MRSAVPVVARQPNTMARCLQVAIPQVPPAPPQQALGPPAGHREDSIDSNTLLVGPDTPTDGHAPSHTTVAVDCGTGLSLSTVV